MATVSKVDIELRSLMTPTIIGLKSLLLLLRYILNESCRLVKSSPNSGNTNVEYPVAVPYISIDFDPVAPRFELTLG